MEIVSIILVLENCEELNIPLENCYHNIFIGRTHKSYMIQHGAFFSSESTDYAKLMFDSSHFNPVYDSGVGIERLKLNDVASIVFKFSDGSEKQIYVPWKGGQFTNKAMKIKYGDNIEFIFDGRSLSAKIYEGFLVLKNYIQKWIK
jgi:hypothetical protein